MPNSNYLKRTFFLIFLAIFLTVFSFAQNTKPIEPREQKLLNGLKLLTWTDPAAPKVTIKIRIHNGSAFDPKDKMGVMALLGDILFPTDQTKAYFTEDLNGSLDVTTTYDYIQISATGKTDEVLSMIETLANAITNPQITQENFVKVRDERIKKVLELEKNPAYIAELAVSKRLFNNFPYGRGVEGTAESLAKIDRPDILLAEQKFFTSDNATIAVIGSVKPDYVYKIVRQLFGAWTKSDKIVPATFRQPDPPVIGQQIIEIPNSANAGIYQASRGYSRNSKEFAAYSVISDALSKRLKLVGNDFKAETVINNYSYLLGGKFVVGVTVPTENASNFIKKIHEVNFVRNFSDTEFQESKNQKLANFNTLLADRTTLADFWLDTDTYKLQPISQQYQALDKLTLTDVNNVLQNTFNGKPFVELVVGDSIKLKDFLAVSK